MDPSPSHASCAAPSTLPAPRGPVDPARATHGLADSACAMHSSVVCAAHDIHCQPHPRLPPSWLEAWSNPTVALAPSSRDEAPVHHPVAIHRYPDHVHIMVTHRLVSVLRPVGRLVLTTDTASAPSPIPSSIRAAVVDPHWRRAMKEYAALLANLMGPSVVSTGHQRSNRQVDFPPQAHL